MTPLLHTSIHGNIRTLVIPIVDANIKYNILGTPLCDQNVKSPGIDGFLYIYNKHEANTNTLPFTVHNEKKLSGFLTPSL